MKNGKKVTNQTILDYPDLDGTDWAHPAWWRGNDDGVRGVAMRIKKILDGKDDGAGVIGYDVLEKVRRTLLEIMRRVKNVKTS